MKRISIYENHSKNLLLLVCGIIILSIGGYFVTNKNSYIFIGFFSIFFIVIATKYKLIDFWFGTQKNKQSEGMKNGDEENDDVKENEKNTKEIRKKQEMIKESNEDNYEEENQNDDDDNEDDYMNGDAKNDNEDLSDKRKEKNVKSSQKKDRRQSKNESSNDENGNGETISEGFKNYLSWSSVESSMDPLVVNSKGSKKSELYMGQRVGQNVSSPGELQSFLNKNYVKTESRNPFGNVLLTDINDSPQRKSAAPSFNPIVNKNITESIKDMVQDLNPTIDNSTKQLFGDLYNNFELDQSNRQFFSTANTRVVNDQGAFANFLYGNMPSGKLDPEAMVQDNLRYILY